MRAWNGPTSRPSRVRPSGNTPTARPSRRRASIASITPAIDSVLPRWWKMVCPRAASQPTTGQPAISRLATNPIMRWLCITSMSTQLTWLATNSTAPGSGVPNRRRRMPKIRISPPDHQRIMRSPRISAPTGTVASGGSRHSKVAGRPISR